MNNNASAIIWTFKMYLSKVYYFNPLLNILGAANHTYNVFQYDAPLLHLINEYIYSVTFSVFPGKPLVSFCVSRPIHSHFNVFQIVDPGHDPAQVRRYAVGLNMLFVKGPDYLILNNQP